MPTTRQDIRAEAMRRLGSHQTVTVHLDPDVTDSAAQRKVITSDVYSIDKTSPHLGQAKLWVPRYNEGNKVRVNSFVAIAKATLVAPTTSDYTIRVYGYGTSGTLTSASTSSDIQTALRAVASGLSSVTVSGSGPFTIAGLPSASVTLELVRATESDETGSITQGMSSFEAVRPFKAGLPYGTSVEILATYPAHDEDGLLGMNVLINQAMDRLWFVDLLHFHSEDPLSQTLTWSLADHPYLAIRKQIIRAYAPCRWKHTFSYTVPATSHTLTLDVGYDADVTTSSLAGSASAALIETTLASALSAVNGSVSVEEDGTTRTVTIDDAYFADLTLTVSSGATVTTTRERMDPLRFTSGYRLKFERDQAIIEWDQPWQRGHTWYLEVYRPVKTRIRRQADYQTLGTAWSDVTDGFTGDLDQCEADVNEVASVAHYLACRQLELYGPSQEKAHWRDERLRAAMIAAQIKSLDLPTASEPGFADEGLTPSRYFQDKGFFSGGY